MSFAVEEYEVRMVELHSLRAGMHDKIAGLLTQWNLNNFVNNEDAISAFDWIVAEALGNVLGCRVLEHWNWDLGETLYGEVESEVHKYLRIILEPTKLEQRLQFIQHIKVMTLGNLLIIGIRYKQ